METKERVEPENLIKLCAGCACGVANDDWTHLDIDPEYADETMTRIEASLEITGWLSYWKTDGAADYFDCGLCGETQCGSAELFSAEKDWRG